MTDLAPEVRMSTRDASWYNNPIQDKPVKFHVVIDHPKNGPVAACDPNIFVDDAFPLESIAVICRCKRAGCRNRWDQ